MNRWSKEKERLKMLTINNVAVGFGLAGIALGLMCVWFGHPYAGVMVGVAVGSIRKD